MKAGNGQHFEQAYNARAGVDVESRLIVAQRVSDAPNDKEQLVPSFQAMAAAAGPVFGIIKEAMGFRRFSMRGMTKVALEWTLVALAYNLKRLFGIGARLAAA